MNIPLSQLSQAPAESSAAGRPAPAAPMLPLSACPVCSHASPGRVPVCKRPLLVLGNRSGRWFMVPASGCSHVNLWAGANSADEQAALVNRWNDWAAKKAPAVVLARGLSEEAAAYFVKMLTSWEF